MSESGDPPLSDAILKSRDSLTNLSDGPAYRPYRLNIPLFPSFKPLELSDQFEVETWVRHFPPYSDFNFVSLWGWNTTEKVALSWLNENLVVRFADYTTGELFLSFLGENEVDNTIEELLRCARREGFRPTLDLVPESAAALTRSSDLARLTHSPEHDDYILATADWAALSGGPFRNKRNEIHRLEREHRPEIRRLDLANDDIQRAISRVFAIWALQRGKVGLPETATESLALRRVFALPFPGDLLGLGVYVESELVGFSINERLPQGYGMGHHWKANGSFPGVYPFLLHKTCEMLAGEDIPLLNIQQDLGSAGLATAKQLYRPTDYLRKFTAELVLPAHADYPLERHTTWDDHVG